MEPEHLVIAWIAKVLCPGCFTNSLLVNYVADSRPVGKETPRHIDQGSSPSSEANYKLPDYIKPVPLAMEQDDIDCLARKNVFMTPTNAFRNACVGSYIHWVHFFCPLLDLHEFLSAIAHPDGLRGQLSLLLFYAVMLGGATFAPDSEIVKAKYKSRLAARKDLFSRCKVSLPMGTSSQWAADDAM